MKLLVLSALIIIFCLHSNAKSQDICHEWFTNTKIAQGSGCLLKCTSALVDMSTFDCHNKCDDLCQTSKKEKLLFQLSDLYPGLTAEERALAAQEPTKALKAYQLSWEAEKICLKDFPTSRTNDESDGCRHFMWAALLEKDLEEDFADKILNAYEQEPIQPENEKAMDLANNRRGMSVGKALQKQNKFDEANLRSAFAEDLKHGRIIVLKRLKSIGGEK